MAYSVANVKPLDGGAGYLRWKESMLLRLHTVGVVHVLSEDAAPAAKKWARDNAICRGEILAALSDRVFPDYVRHADARELWQAVARTYDVDTSGVARQRFFSFEFKEDASLPEQIACMEALAADMDPTTLPHGFLTWTVCGKLPPKVKKGLLDILGPLSCLTTDEGKPLFQICDETIGMGKVWDLARATEKARMENKLPTSKVKVEEENMQF